MGYSPEDLDLEEAKAIALGLGVPKFLIENLNVLPVRGKSRTGRPGWKLTNKFVTTNNIVATYRYVSICSYI